MKKVANCFMSMDSISRARAIFNSVVSMNGFRVVLIALLMLVCGSGSLFAQDTITISVVSGGTRYYFADNGSGTITNPFNNLTSNCLWVIQKQGNGGNQYTFKNVGTGRWLRYTNGNSYFTLNEDNSSSFTLSIAFASPNTTASLRGPSNGRYLRYNDDGWTNGRNASNLTFESWTRKEVKGGLKGEFNNGDVDFGWADSDSVAATQSITKTFTISVTPSETYYDCVSTAAVEKVGLTTVEPTGTPEISSISFAFANKGQCNDCEIYTDRTLKTRTLLTVTGEKDNTKVNTWNVTIKPVGSSPMELKNGDYWADFTDNLVVSFREKGDTDEKNNQAEFPVKRRSYHREVLPAFVVSLDPGSYSFPKDTSSTTFTITCKHQHGELIKHMFGLVSSNNMPDEEYPYATIETIEPTSDFVSFAAKNMSDETTASWLTVGTISGGKITLTARPNNSGSMRKARFAGSFNYVNPTDPTDKHFAYIEIPITQRYKDGNMVFVPNRGHSGDALVAHPYIENEYEQQVHMVSKTIYYLPGDSIALRLQENTFRKYRRWYDYETGCNPVYNANAADRTTWVTAPNTGNRTTPNYIEINNTPGDSYGLYSTNNKGNLASDVPVLKGWADGKAHVMACDVSAHTDYTIKDDTIIEPTLSYRQVFHLRPASEMANKLDSLSRIGKYLETYTYMVPTGQVLLLSTEFRYLATKANHKSECCYFYKKGTTLTRISKDCEWYKNNTGITEVYGTKDYLQVDAVTSPGDTVIYQLRLPKSDSGLDYDLLIAEFEVIYVDNAAHGPVNGNTGGNEIISYNDIAAHYQILEFNNFNYGAAAPGTNEVNRHSGKRLPWNEATYGFYYPNLDDCDRQNSGQGDIPYYGEYTLLNRMQGGGTNGWGKGEQHGGAANGYALYVDGTEEPGLVASISTAAEICDGQTMYCSMWLMNPRTSGNGNGAVNPIFRCNIQGRKKIGDAYGEWEDAGIYYVGEVGTSGHIGTGWQQIVFPVKSATSYKETRVQIYNFGTGGTGNDFLLDDICLYASPLPLAAYHATTGCTSYSNTATTNTVVVLRIDYDQLNEDQTDKFMYYHIYNVTDTQTVALRERVKVGDSDEYTLKSVYYNEAGLVNSPTLNTDTVGSIKIPKSRVESGIVDTITSINNYIKMLTPAAGETSKSGKCFIYDNSTGKWFLYLVHVIPTGSGEIGEDGVYLDREKTYSLRIANAHGDLYKAACVFTTELHAAQDTYVELRNEQVDSVRITGCMDELCANNHHFLAVKVENTITPTAGGALQTISAMVHADWLVGIASDSIYCNESAITSATQTAADAAFKQKYGFNRNEIEDAIIAMRNTSATNTNRRVSNPKDLVVISGMFTDSNKIVITDLYNRGLLKLYQKTEMFYMGSQDTARYWVYPVAEDAQVTFNGKPYTLSDCNEPKWVQVVSSFSEYAVNLSPIDKEHQTPQQRLELPSVRILEGTTDVVIPVKELTDSTKLYGGLSASREFVTFKYNEPVEHVLEYVDLSNNRIDIVDAPTSLVAGDEYLMRMAFYDQQGNAYIRGDSTECRVGYIYFYLTVVPRTVQWTGEYSPIWGDDKNWKGVKADGTLMDVGFAPLPETNVIIRPLPADKPYPIVMTDDHYPMDVYHHPNACNKIYFAPGTMIHNQHLLEYNQAFVDMKIPAGTWNAMSAPLEGMYTGDMYIPHEGSYKDAGAKSLESSDPFVVAPFSGTRTSSALYAFWQGMYNQAVKNYHVNGNYSTPQVTEATKFVQTNLLEYELKPGSGYQLKGYGKDSDTALIIRLPKPDAYYTYYDSVGNKLTNVPVNKHSSKLAFKLDGSKEMKIPLNNQIEDNKFMFGNPTMSNIDMTKFLETNTNIAAYYLMENNSWTPANALTGGVLAPMRSVLLSLKDSSEAKQITLTLKPEHLEMPTVHVNTANPVNAPRKNSASAKKDDAMFMTIYSLSDRGEARCVLASTEGADDSYQSNEDVLFISSGVENDSYVTSPINMYTVSDRVPMMVDVREKIDTVPLSMLVHEKSRTEKVKFAFYLSLNWDKECYFCDAVTGERYRIMDGLWLELDMPQNHEVRYFIDGPDVIDPDGGGDIWSSTEDVKTSTNQVWAYSPSQGQLVVASNDIIKAVMVYDIAGRLIGHRELEMQYNSTTFDTPTGACIVKAVLRDNTEHYISALVK